MAKDRFEAQLKCPKCGREGVAKLEEEDGWSFMKGDQTTKVKQLPNGFKVVDQPSRMGSVDLHCKDCSVSAIVF